MKEPVECDFHGFKHRPFGNDGPHGHHGHHDHRFHGPRPHSHFGPWMIRPFKPFNPCDQDYKCFDKRCGPMDGLGSKSGPSYPRGSGYQFVRGSQGHGLHRCCDDLPELECDECCTPINGPGCPVNVPFSPWGQGCQRRHREHPGRDGSRRPMDGPGCENIPRHPCGCTRRREDRGGPEHDGHCRQDGHEHGRKGFKDTNMGQRSCNKINKKDQGTQAIIIERVIIDNDARCNSV